jgi:hypothetical protein
MRVVGGLVIVAALCFALNGLYQVVRKPSELFFPVSGTLSKTPAETWQSYKSLFQRYSTSVMTPELLAALAQVEGSGNPVARTYWRWLITTEPLKIYRPASSAVGMYQITDGTFEQARRFCIREHAVVDDCWTNALYTRVVPAHAVELTSAYLHRQVLNTLADAHVRRATLRQQQDLATLIHLCGAGAGKAYASRGLRLAPGQRCGEHAAGAYLERVHEELRVFSRFAAVDRSSRAR